jgi:ABC-2 type transport system permease protein
MSASPSFSHDGLSARLRRLTALVRKETRQLVRDPGSLAMGVIMPVLLILLFGYGLSLDVKNIHLAIVLEDHSAAATALAGGFQGSPYFAPTIQPSWPAAREMVLNRQADAILRIPAHFAQRLGEGSADLQLLLNGSDANRARIIQAYVQGVVGQWSAQAANPAHRSATALLVDRIWFNEARDSSYFLVPGLIVLVMTLIGAFMTAMVVAREWERGTLEALFVTPVRAGEILLSKMIPYFLLGMIGFTLCLLATRFLFHVPLRGSLAVLIGVSMLYLLVALGIGLLVSSVVKSQFVASQIAVLATFLPALLLSGFLFDIRSMPPFVRLLTYAVPARYYVTLLQTLFLAGNLWSVILPNALILLAIALLVLGLARLATRKTLA